MVKYGARDQSSKKKKIIRGARIMGKSINQLSNTEIVKKNKFRPREYNKVEAILRHRGLEWAEAT
jgi:hypothetical protein